MNVLCWFVRVHLSGQKICQNVQIYTFQFSKTILRPSYSLNGPLHYQQSTFNNSNSTKSLHKSLIPEERLVSRLCAVKMYRMHLNVVYLAFWAIFGPDLLNPTWPRHIYHFKSPGGGRILPPSKMRNIAYEILKFCIYVVLVISNLFSDFQLLRVVFSEITSIVLKQ